MKGFRRPLPHVVYRTIPKKHMRHWFWRHHRDIVTDRLNHHWPGGIALGMAYARSVLWLTRHLWPRWWAGSKSSLAGQVISPRWLLGPLPGSDWSEFRWLLFFAGTASLNAGTGVWLALHQGWPWPVLAFAAAISSSSFLVITFTRWRKTWDSPKPPTSKSLPQSQAQYISRMFNVPPSLLGSLSASPSPPSPLATQMIKNALTGAPWGWGRSALPIAAGPIQSMAVDMPVVGYRSWTVTVDGIRSINASGGGWMPGINRAECKKALAVGFGIPRAVEPHESPDAQCACGLYGWHQPSNDDREMTGRVMGAVLAWGRIIRHGQEGFRAEFMRPICLARPERDDYRSHDKTGPMCEKVTMEQGGFLLKDVPWQSDFQVIPGTFHCVAGKGATCVACGATVLHPMTDSAWDILLASRVSLAETLKLPLVPIEHLETYAREFGQSIKDLQAPPVPPPAKGDEIRVPSKPDGVTWSAHVYRLIQERRFKRDFMGDPIKPALRFSREDFDDLVRNLDPWLAPMGDPRLSTMYGHPVIIDP